MYLARFILALALVAAGTAGCLEDNARPYDDYLGDLADLPDAGMRPDAGPPLCSTSSGPSITVEFSNRTGRHGRLMWADEQCTTRQYATLRNGESHSQQTYVGHAWRLLREADDQILGQVIVGDGQTSVTFE